MNIEFYESENQPPLTGPKLWLRTSDMAHFARDEVRGWVPYKPLDIRLRMKVGDKATVAIQEAH